MFKTIKKKYILDKKISKIQTNYKIKHRLVKLVGSNIFDNKIYNTLDLLKKIKFNNLKLDLVVINENTLPPLVKILDFNKYIYDIKKKYKKSLKSNPIKIIRLSPQINKHDLDFKMKQAKKFLINKSKVKLYVFFKGRSIIYKNQGVDLLNNCYNFLKEFCTIEKKPYMDYNKMYMIVNPTIKKNEKKN